jgi:hypothetical protein
MKREKYRKKIHNDCLSNDSAMLMIQKCCLPCWLKRDNNKLLDARNRFVLMNKNGVPMPLVKQGFIDSSKK